MTFQSESEYLSAVIGRIKCAYLTEISHNDQDLSAISNTIRSISEAYLYRFERDVLPSAHEILKLARTGWPLPVLTVCGHGTREIRYSSLLSYILDPTRMHGLGCIPVRSFIDLAKSRFNEVNMEPTDSEDEISVFNELYLGQSDCRHGCIADIVIEASAFVLIVENKINSGVNKDKHLDFHQLRDYMLVARKKYQTKQVMGILIAPVKREMDDSLLSQSWISISYSEIIDSLMPILAKDRISHCARENLRRVLFDLASGPLDRVETDLEDLSHQAGELTIPAGRTPRRIVSFLSQCDEHKNLIAIALETNHEQTS